MLRSLIALILTVLVLSGLPALAQQDTPDEGIERTDLFSPVIVDGERLFVLRGASGLPAERRAAEVVERIEAIAAASMAESVTITTQPNAFGIAILADGVEVVTVTTADARLERLDIDTLIEVQGNAIRDAILNYRSARTDSARLESAIEALAWTGGFVLFTLIGFWIRRRLNRICTRLVRRYFAGLESATNAQVQADAIAALIRFGLNFVLLALFFLGIYYYLSLVLLSFAETRYVAQLLLTYVTTPVLNIVFGFVGYLPNLITLAIIALITRYVIRGLKVFFDAVEAGSFDLGDFERHWIGPTFNILRVVVVMIALVFSFPYIPGSDSAAFQGLTILVGAMLSLGSNSVMNNVISGLFVIYRRSTSIGDRIRIGEHVGDVVQIKLMETHLKSIKNEMISIPNAQLLNSDVINYTKHIDGNGLLVYTTVGIGYEEPADKVEAMLIEAAQRTKGLKARPAPFVLWSALADYAVNYQINAYTTRGAIIPKITSDLHRNILDVFTENEVQIMTPSYIADPPEPKIAPAGWDGVLAHQRKEM